jgi:uncharacterized SAM-binding protein YcdF (DUF218 family)
MIRKRGSVHISQQKSSLKVFFILSPFLILLCWWGTRQIRAISTEPQAIFVLGGSEDREHVAAQLARIHPDIPIWISSGSPDSYARLIFHNLGIDENRLHLDHQAIDTVTNFTTLVDLFKSEKIDNVYLVTSDYHMRRAFFIEEIIFGSRGIVVRPISVQSSNGSESWKKSLRDVIRSFWWLATGSTGRI